MKPQRALVDVERQDDDELAGEGWRQGGLAPPDELRAELPDRQGLARARAPAPGGRVPVGMQRILDDRGRDPRPWDERVLRRAEAAHDPRVAASPHQEPDRATRRPHRSSRGQQSLLHRVLPDDLVRAATFHGQAARPASDARTLADAPVPTRSAPCPSELLESELRRGAAVITCAHHVEHHLHACSDALDEVRLADVVGALAQVELIGRRRRGGDGRCDREREHAGEQRAKEPCRWASRANRAHGVKVRRLGDFGSGWSFRDAA